MEDKRYLELRKKARKKLDQFRQIEKEKGFAAPEDCPVDIHLQTALDAIRCGIQIDDINNIVEGLLMGEDALERLRNNKYSN